MSQSTKILKEFGSLSVKEDLKFKPGSTNALGASRTPAPITLDDDAVTLTNEQLRSGILVQTPTVARNVTLPTAVDLIEFLTSVGDSFDFHFINLGNDGVNSTIVAGTGGTSVGLLTVRDSNVVTAPDSGSAHFRVRATNVDDGTEAYVIYRL